MPDITVDVSPADGGAGIATVTLTADFTYINTSRALSALLSNSKSPIFDEVKDLSAAASGQNTIVLPTNPRAPGGVIILPPQEATYRVEITDSAWSSAVKLNKTGPALLCFDQASMPTNLYLKWNGKGYKATAVTADGATDKITHTGHTFVDGDRVRIDETTGTVPTGLSTGIWYYVVNQATNEYKLALTSGGTAIDITSAGATVKVTSADRFHFYWF